MHYARRASHIPGGGWRLLANLAIRLTRFRARAADPDVDEASRQRDAGNFRCSGEKDGHESGRDTAGVCGGAVEVGRGVEIM